MNKEKLIEELKIINNNLVKKIRLQQTKHEETEKLIEVNFELRNLFEKIENGEFDNE